MVVFGDSLSDTGNTAAAITAALGGEAGGLAAGLPQTELPFAPFYDNGRLTNGPTTSPSSSIKGVWVEQLAPKIGVATPTNSVAGGTNFAWAGAETGSGTGYNGLVQNMGNQLLAYCGGCGSVSSHNLYVLWGGADDIFDAFTNSQDPVAAANAAAANIAAYIGTLANAGGTNFLWPNLPPLGFIPQTLGAPPAVATAAEIAAQAFNTQWAADIGALEAAHPGISIEGLDTFGLFQSIATNPAAYGLANITVPAANFLNGGLNVNPDTFLFWDLQHPTSRGHEILADAAAVPEPSTVALAGFGFALLVVARRRRARR
jgi:phospholipase/lecithinase/hemolysin